MTIPTEVQTLTIEGRDYALVPTDILREHAPQLLGTLSAPRIPEDPYIPLEVVRRSISDEVPMIRAWREYLNLSQEEVAARMGVSQASLSQTEAAKRPRRATLEKVAEALGITVEQLRG
ncbi:helix-turn-helix transcriptional regulator [soil metagenome]